MIKENAVKNNSTIAVFEERTAAYKIVAGKIRDLVEARQQAGEKAVLGMATGATPIGVYKELVRMHTEEQLSFQNVVTFNLDEYYPMVPSDVNSYVYYMHHHLFKHIDIPRENIHIPDGTISAESVAAFCEAYDHKIRSFGGIDIQLLGIGRTGHIGFNEPPAGAGTRTRLVALDAMTIEDAAKDFGSTGATPTKAITMGIAPILEAKEIFVMGWGEKKAAIIKEAIEGAVDDRVPASHLQNARCVHWLLDAAAASALTGVR